MTIAIRVELNERRRSPRRGKPSDKEPRIGQYKVRRQGVGAPALWLPPKGFDSAAHSRALAPCQTHRNRHGFGQTPTSAKFSAEFIVCAVQRDERGAHDLLMPHWRSKFHTLQLASASGVRGRSGLLFGRRTKFLAGLCHLRFENRARLLPLLIAQWNLATALGFA